MGTNPSLYRGPDRPVDRASWNDANRFCQLVGMRLPTELEWEYPARGGSAGPRYGELDQIAWFDGNSHDQTHNVATKLPNAYGLYDLLGNVCEFVQDSFEAEPGKKIARRLLLQSRESSQSLRQALGYARYRTPRYGLSLRGASKFSRRCP